MLQRIVNLEKIVYDLYCKVKDIIANGTGGGTTAANLKEGAGISLTNQTNPDATVVSLSTEVTNKLDQLGGNIGEWYTINFDMTAENGFQYYDYNQDTYLPLIDEAGFEKFVRYTLLGGVTTSPIQIGRFKMEGNRITAHVNYPQDAVNNGEFYVSLNFSKYKVYQLPTIGGHIYYSFNSNNYTLQDYTTLLTWVQSGQLKPGYLMNFSYNTDSVIGTPLQIALTNMGFIVQDENTTIYPNNGGAGGAGGGS